MTTDKWEISPSNMNKTLDRIERLAECYDFSSKELLQIRLLCEETLSVLAPALYPFSGRCWVATDKKGFAFTVSCSTDSRSISPETRKKLLDMDKSSRKPGIFGAIERTLSSMFTQEFAGSTGFDMVYMETLAYHGMGGGSYVWQAAHDAYMLVPHESAGSQSPKDDDGLEISIVEGYADDIRAAVRLGGILEITVVKHYSKPPEGMELA